SDIRASAGNEPQRVAGGWEVEIPREKVPEDGRVTFWAVDPVSSARGSEEIELGADPTPGVRIRLEAPEVTVRGTVFGRDGRVLAGARVSVSGRGDEAVVTGSGGSFELPAHRSPGEQVRLHVEHPDYPAKDLYCWAGSDACQVRLGPG
ncbi:MAG: carboxypeptidase-like regulatory domain-containing protein, partial [Gemmatimonadota bacterium]